MKDSFGLDNSCDLCNRPAILWYISWNKHGRRRIDSHSRCGMCIGNRLPSDSDASRACKSSSREEAEAALRVAWVEELMEN